MTRISTRHIEPLLPERRVSLAADVAHGTQTLEQVHAFEAQIAPRELDDLMFFTTFKLPLLENYMKNLATATGHGIRLAWKPAGGDGTLGQVTGGTFDTYLNESASAIKTWGLPITIRLAHEFNGNYNTYGTFNESAAAFIAGWKYIVELFASKGVTNVKWAWNPNVWPGPSTTDPTTYYPGDAFVNIIGLDGYMRKGATIKQPEEIFLTYYNTLHELAPTRPFYIFETGVAEDSRFSKATWFNNLAILIRDTIPVEGLGYWNRYEVSESESDYTIDSSGTEGPTNPAALAAFREMVNTPAFASGSAPAPPTGTVRPEDLLMVGVG